MIWDTAVHPHPASPLKGEELKTRAGIVPSPLRGRNVHHRHFRVRMGVETILYPCFRDDLRWRN